MHTKTGPRAGYTHSLSQLTKLAFSTIVVAAAVAANAAPAAATGTVQGRVLDAENGLYLPNAHVTIKGTSLEAYTDNSGFYTINNVPSGSDKIVVTYTGIKAVTTEVSLAPGGTANVDLTMNADKVKRSSNGTIMLDPYTVAANRFKNAAQIAINEEKNSINIKDVISVKSFGVIPSGNVGELVKFLPGVQVDYGAYGGAQSGYSDNTASGVSVRGFGPEDTAVLIDGMPVSNSTPGSLTNQVGLDMLSINNASRVELIKVATPDMPNNSIGGQVNLITKSAFEYAKPTYSYQLLFNFNSLDRSLSKTVGPVNKKTYKVTPGINFSVAYPVTKNFGFTITGMAQREFDQTYRAQPYWAYTGINSKYTNSQGVASISNPVLNRFVITNTPRMVDQTSGNIKFDWKPSPAQKLTANFQYSTYNSTEADRSLDIRPTIAAGSDWGGTYTTGSVANSNLNMRVVTLDKIGSTKSGYLKYNFDKSGWDIDASGSLSISNGRYADVENGHYSELDLQANPGQITFNNIVNGIPKSVQVFARTSSGGGPLDFTQLENWKISNLYAQQGDANNRDTVGLYQVNLARSLDFIPWLGSNSLTVKTGFRRDTQKDEKWGLGTGYKLDLNPGKTFDVAQILDTNYVGQSPGYGFAPQQWGSTYALYQLNQSQDLFYAPTDGSDGVGNYNSWANQQKSITITKDAYYGMLTGSFFHNRLTFVGGARIENQKREGRGPYTNSKWNYAVNPNGTLYRDQYYQGGVTFDGSKMTRINADGTTTVITDFLSDPALLSRMSAAGVVYPNQLLGSYKTSVASAQRYLVANHPIDERVHGKASPSLSTAFKVTKKIIVQVAWSRSFGLPSLEDSTQGILSGNGAFTINEYNTPASDGTLGQIKVANPALQPEISDNWDFQTSYYTDSGGKLSIDYYMKSVTNQVQTYTTYSNDPLFATIMNAIGLDPTAYQDWTIATSANSSTKQKTSGVELSAQQNFAFLGGWGSHFQAFATYTVNSLGTPSAPTPQTVTTPDGSTVTITPTVSTITLRANHFGSAGLQFSTDHFSAQIRGTYRNRNEISRTTLANGDVLRQMQPAETRIDVEAEYRFKKHYSVFISGRDVFNAERKIVLQDDQNLLPAYAKTYDLRRFGVTWTVGLNAQF